MTKNDAFLLAATTTGNYPSGTSAADLHEVKPFPPGHRNLCGSVHHRPTALDEAIYAGNYPRGTTLQELYDLNFCYVFDALKSGNYPAGTSAADLAKIKCPKALKKEDHALGIAVRWFGRYPTNTTAKDLANFPCIKRFAAWYNQITLPRGRTFLHEAARFGRFPAGTVISDLLEHRDQLGNTPLHDLAGNCNLDRIEGVGKAILLSVANNAGETAWDLAWTEKTSDACYDYYEVVANLVGCIELFERLDRRKKVHRVILGLVKDDCRLTQEKRDQIAGRFPKLVAEILL